MKVVSHDEPRKIDYEFKSFGFNDIEEDPNILVKLYPEDSKYIVLQIDCDVESHYTILLYNDRFKDGKEGRVLFDGFVKTGIFCRMLLASLEFDNRI